MPRDYEVYTCNDQRYSPRPSRIQSLRATYESLEEEKGEPQDNKPAPVWTTKSGLGTGDSLDTIGNRVKGDL